MGVLNMPIDASKVQWDAPAIDPAKVQWDAAPAPVPAVASSRQPGVFEKALGVVAGVPAAAYGLLEVPTTVATGALGQLVGVPVGIASTFGKGFGTPEATRIAEQRAARIARALTYQPQTPVGQTIVGGMAKASEVLPPIIGSNLGAAMSALAPAATQQAIQSAQKFLSPSEAKLARLSAQSYARGPQIDAIKEAQRMGIVLNPADVDPSSVGAKLSSAAAGVKGERAIERANVPKVNEIARNEMGLPAGTSLAGPKAFNDARAAIAEPYDRVKAIPEIAPNDASISALKELATDSALIGGETTAKAVNKLVASAVDTAGKGLSGEALLNNIRNLRTTAKRIYNNPSASPKQLSVADVNKKIATILEDMIDTSIADPTLLADFRNARRQMARIYGYEAATDFNTGVVSAPKLAKITAGDNALTGDIASLGQIAGNFPSAFKVGAEAPWYSMPRLSRSGAAGATGALIGSQFGGMTGAILGGAIGGGVGEFGSSLMARRIASPGYQAGLRVLDQRLPMNYLAAQRGYPASTVESQNALTP